MRREATSWPALGKPLRSARAFLRHFLFAEAPVSSRAAEGLQVPRNQGGSIRKLAGTVTAHRGGSALTPSTQALRERRGLEARRGVLKGTPAHYKGFSQEETSHSPLPLVLAVTFSAHSLLGVRLVCVPSTGRAQRAKRSPEHGPRAMAL